MRSIWMIPALPIITLSAFCGQASWAQNPPDPFANLHNAEKNAKRASKDPAVTPGDLRSPNVEQTVRQLKAVLKLSADQQAYVTALLADRERRLGQIPPALPADERAIQTEGIYRYTEQQLMAGLSTKQLLDFKLNYHDGRGGDPERLRKLSTINQSLAYTATPEAIVRWQGFVPLTDEQKTALMPLLNTQLRELHSARRLDRSPENAIREQTAMVRAERQIDALLTPEQKTVIEKMLLLPLPAKYVPAITPTPKQGSSPG